MISILVTGISGRMGQAIQEAVTQNPDTCVGSTHDQGQELYPALAKCDVAIDFSHHAFTSTLLAEAVANNKPLVIGTTGHTELERQEIVDAAASIPIVFASNYSVGVNALFWLTLVPITAGITSNMAINGNAAAPIIFLVIFNAVQFALRFWLMNWSYKLGTSAIDALTANMQAFTRAASIMGVFVVGCLVVTMGGTQINLQIPNGTTRGLSANTVIVSEKEAENFTGMEGIDTETAEAGTIAMTDEDGNALTAVDADGNEVKCGVADLGNGMESVTYATVTEDPVNFSVADTLNTIVPKLVPLMLTLLLYYMFAKHSWTPTKGILLLFVLGILGAGPLGLWPSIW